VLQSWVIFLISLVYIGVLFALAYYVDKRTDRGRSFSNPYIYALSLAVYCTDWTFYGSVGRAADTGLGFLPIYLGPTLMAALWWFVLRKIIRISKANRIVSIADFIASRYGKSTALGGLVTVIAIIGIIPYISLQLKGVSTSFTLLWHYPDLTPPKLGAIPVLEDTGFYVAIALAIFAILFGVRHLDAAEHHEGMVTAIAFESVIKLVAFVAAGAFVTYGIFDGFGDLFAQAAANPNLSALFTLEGAGGGYGSWFGLIFLSMLAIMFLPRQFQVAVVENVNEQHLSKAIWLFPLYLLGINIFVLPITFGGLLLFPGDVDPDTFVLTLPMAYGQESLALFVFLGGLSAATGMVIVETVALSTMVSNDLVIPVLLRLEGLRLAEREDLSRLLLIIRRSAIVVTVLLGYLYFRLTSEVYALVSIGLVSFAAVAQFAPAILGGIYWKGGARTGALVGLSAGFVVWTHTLLLPSLAESGLLSASIMTEGPFGLTWLKPYELFGLSGWSPITHALFWSLLVNVAGYVGGSLLGRQSVIEHSQASLFVDVFRRSVEGSQINLWRGTASVSDLRLLLGRFLGPGRADEVLTEYARQRSLNWAEIANADAELVNYAEKLLAGSIGAASARVMMASVVKEEPLNMGEVMGMLDETIAYSRQLEQKSQELEAATGELRAANERLKELDRLKDDFISTVTHELRTPLTSIRAFSEILHDNPELDSPRRTQFLSIIIKENERLTRLINQVLDLAKIESGNAEWNLSEFDLIEVIEESLKTLGQLLTENHIKLEIDLPEQVPILVADRDRITQVLLNLLSNAIKFCDKSAGWIRIGLQVQAEAVEVSVSDNGPGISPADQKIIFDKFRQVGDTLTDKPQGTGLGLPICRHIITYFGGELRVESQLGHGATFIFTLPFTPLPSYADQLVPSLDLEAEKLIVVEDQIR
jgi:Na+/proline symporter/nitrogen-specific signal transduction histidine kinase